MTPSPDDELLAILLANLRNAAATFGEGSPHCESIRTTVEEHLRNMKARGAATNITETRNVTHGTAAPKTDEQLNVSFGNLALRPKPAAK